MKGTVLARTWAAMAGLVGLLFAATAHADPAPDAGAPAARAPVVALYASPMFGTDASSGTGWSEIIARIENLSAISQKGTVELTTSGGAGSSERFTARAPFSVPVGRTAVVHLLVHGSSYYTPTPTVTATSETGEELAKATVTVSTATGPLLVDVDQPSRLSVVMRGWPISTPWSMTNTYFGGAAGTATQPLTVGAPTFDRVTGDPILPDHAATYSAATVVVIHSDVLAKLDPTALDALVNWALAGGTLAIVPNRPEDLRGAVVSALVGGIVTKADVPGHLLTLPGATKPGPSFDNKLDPSVPVTPPQEAAPLKFDGDDGPLRLTPITRPMAAPRAGPGAAVKGLLSGYTGGNLQESDFGATAAYGLGEVHLLAFDPTVAPMLDDAWVHARVTDLLARAWDRRALGALAPGTGERGSQADNIRRELDPNENFRVGLAISAILLVIYSVIAGPVTFARAAKKGTPFSPLKWAPLWSLLAFASIVVVGLASKGWRGRARHLSIVEAGAGVTRGSVRRFRGFFASEARALTVRATDRTCVLDVADSDDSHENAEIRLDRNGVSLSNLTSLPWQTVVVREDGFMDFTGAVSVIPTPDGSADIVNHTGQPLADVMVWMPGAGITYFEEIKDGAKVHAALGKSLLSASARHAQKAGARTVHPLGAVGLGLAAGKTFSSRAAWSALESAAKTSTDWWPDDVPVVIGEVMGGAHPSSDSGLALESDRVLFRVVGHGGAP